MRVAFDIGGTFTDFVLEDLRAGVLRFHKVATTPRDPAIAVLEGLETLLRTAEVAPAEVSGILHATTVATNAILERKGARTALITTAGFRDVLIIGRQKRYDTYDMYLAKPVPLVRRRDIFEVGERTLADGTVEHPLDAAAARARCWGGSPAETYELIAVCLLHAYAAPAHEQADRRAAGRAHARCRRVALVRRLAQVSASTSAPARWWPTPTSSPSSAATSAGWRAP